MYIQVTEVCTGSKTGEEELSASMKLVLCDSCVCISQHILNEGQCKADVLRLGV